MPNPLPKILAEQVAVFRKNTEWEREYHGKWMISEEPGIVFLQEALTEAYRAGERSVLEEMRHDQQKFQDGFGHPKDCPRCLADISKDGAITR